MGNLASALSKNGTRLAARQAEWIGKRVVDKKTKKKGLRQEEVAIGSISSGEGDQSMLKEIPSADMTKALAGMITSRTKRFVEVEDMHRRVPNKDTSNARKRHRLGTKDIRRLTEAIIDSPDSNLERVCKDMCYDVPYEHVKKLVAGVSVPVVRRGPHGISVAAPPKRRGMVPT